MSQAYGNIIVTVSWSIVFTEANGDSRENNQGERVGCLSCSYGPVVGAA